MSQAKTDNSFFDAKIRLRMDNLPKGKGLEVLDCFAGQGTLWREVRRCLPDRKLVVLSMDQKTKSDCLGLIGDNVKFLASMDLMRFDVIDLDAYGSPFRQLKIVLGRPLKPGVVIFGTFIQSVMGMLPHDFLAELGYTPAMVRKMPTLFCRHGQAKLLAWLGNKGAQSLKMYSTENGRKSVHHFMIRKVQ